ncbi:UNVERIFIED_CONTAM: hypothetical protein FKN15_038481 [Acipenser sinensis]
MGADWPQEDILSITASDEVGKLKLGFPSDSTSPAVKLSLSAELLPLIKRATAILQKEKQGSQFLMMAQSSLRCPPSPPQVPKLALLTKDAACPNKQCRVSENILKRAYSVGVFAALLGNYNSILVAYQTCLLKAVSESHRPSPQQLEELRFLNKNLLRISNLNKQAVGRNLAALVAAR